MSAYSASKTSRSKSSSSLSDWAQVSLQVINSRSYPEMFDPSVFSGTNAKTVFSRKDKFRDTNSPSLPASSISWLAIAPNPKISSSAEISLVHQAQVRNNCSCFDLFITVNFTNIIRLLIEKILV